MNTLQFDTLEEFRSPSANWSVAGDVYSDLTENHHMDVKPGSGVLVNIPSEEHGGHLVTNLEHGDMELRGEFLVPKGSNSGLYFQSRYELQILDSWLVENPTFHDNGGIYERWDDTKPEGQQGFDGVAPRVNASKAPGLWQDFHILFRAPRFDDMGNKTENARFEYVYLNGTLIHENVEVTGPTRAAAYMDEVPEAPLLIQGSHGPVAIRNFEYKTFSQQDSLSISNLQYTVYDYEGNTMPDFETLEVIAEGVTDSFNVRDLSPQSDHYAMQFTGDLHVPVTGEYLIETFMDKAGDLFINDELVVYNSEDLDSRRRGNIVHLTEGTHRLDVTFMQVRWNGAVTIYYEGPNIEKRTLASFHPWESNDSWSPQVHEPKDDEPEIVAAFATIDGEVRTQLRNIGHPDGFNYTYDLERAALVRFWRGPFADVSQMWEGRGHAQTLHPLNAAVYASAGVPVVDIRSRNLMSKHDIPEGFRGGYSYSLIEGIPEFVSEYDGLTIRDLIKPSENKEHLLRTIQAEVTKNQGNKALRLAQGDDITLLDNGMYRIDGQYYVRPVDDISDQASLTTVQGQQILSIPLPRAGNSKNISYEIIW